MYSKVAKIRVSNFFFKFLIFFENFEKNNVKKKTLGIFLTFSFYKKEVRI